MANAKNFGQQINGFVGGLITEATELTFPPNASTDELNCVLFSAGNRRRRLGVDFQNEYELSSFFLTQGQQETFAVNSFTWRGVREKGALNFFVVQLGNKVYFYDHNTSPLSSGEKPFSIDLDAHLAPAATTSALTSASFAAGRGALFIVSASTIPIKVEYDEAADDINVERINIRIRDFDGVEDGLNVEARPQNLSKEHHYNLLNQGWFRTSGNYDPIQNYKNNEGVYPANNLQWFRAKGQSGQISFALLNGVVVGSSEAPRGHFILDPFYKDRTAATIPPNGGAPLVPGLPVESIDARPQAVGFFAGRVAYALNGDVYISQVLNTARDNAGKCYQNADPSSEVLNELVATDGLVITIPNAHDILAMSEVGSALFVFAKNGVWSISGTDGGFRADDFKVSKITSSGIISNRALVEIEGLPVWLSETGIYVLQSGQTGDLQAVSITEEKIHTFYNNIDLVTLANSTGAFDKAQSRIMWFYKDPDTATPSSSPYFYNRALVYDVRLQAFYPWAISSAENLSPFICGIAVTPAINEGDNSQDVVVMDEIVEAGGDAVEVITTERIGQPTFFQYMTLVPDGGDYRLTFSDFTNNLFTDWEKYARLLDEDGEGVSFDSYLETGWDIQGDVSRFKQMPYITVHCKRTETGVTFISGEPVYENPSNLFVRAKWDWANGSQSGKWSTRQKAYRLKDIYLPPADDGTWENGLGLTSTKLRIRGSGRALQLRFESDPGKDFNLIGWGTVLTGTTDS